jgi:hypothetical protein
MSGNLNGNHNISFLGGLQGNSHHELSGSPKCPVPLSICVSGLPVSEGQALEDVLRALAARNACTEPSTGRERLWKLLRDLKAIEEGIGSELDIADVAAAAGAINRIQRRRDPRDGLRVSGSESHAQFLGIGRRHRIWIRVCGKSNLAGSLARLRALGSRPDACLDAECAAHRVSARSDRGRLGSRSVQRSA